MVLKKHEQRISIPWATNFAPTGNGFRRVQLERFISPVSEKYFPNWGFFLLQLMVGMYVVCMFVLPVGCTHGMCESHHMKPQSGVQITV